MVFKSLPIAALLAGASPVYAGHFIFHYEGDPTQSAAGSPLSANLYLTTSDTLNALGGYDILSASGTVDGTAITGLVPNPNTPDTSSNGVYIFDDILFPSGPALDDPGLVVSIAALSYNFGYSGGYYAIAMDGNTHVNRNGQTVFNTFFGVGDASLTAVPEPAAWTMMVMGFGLAGATMRRRRATIAFI